MKTGVLLHAYHLDAIGWEDLIWGDPSVDRLGSMPALAWLFLTESADAPISQVVIGCGPGVKDGRSESAYTKRFILERFERLAEFPRLASLFTQLSKDEYTRLRDRFESIVTMPLIRGTKEEVSTAAEMFTEAGIAKAFQICAASHAPRCIQILAACRLRGQIPAYQQWTVMPSDMCFAHAKPDDTLILEPPHRGDDPMLSVMPGIAQVLKPYHYGLSANKKLELIKMIGTFMDQNGQDG